MAEKWLYWPDELRRAQNGLVGKERAHAWEAAKIGLPVLQGFSLSVHAYTHFMLETAATPEIAEMISASGITAADTTGVQRLSPVICGVVESKTIPAEMESIGDCHKHMRRVDGQGRLHVLGCHLVISLGLTEGKNAEAKKPAPAHIGRSFGKWWIGKVCSGAGVWQSRRAMERGITLTIEP